MTSSLEWLSDAPSDEEILAWAQSTSAEHRTSVAEALHDDQVRHQWRSDPALPLAMLAMVDDPVQLSELIRWCHDPQRPHLVEALLTRRSRSWRERVVSSTLTSRFGNPSGRSWWLLRALIRVGVTVERGPEYLMMLLASHGIWKAREPDDILEFLNQEPDLLTSEVFLLLSTETVTRRLDTDEWLGAYEKLARGEQRKRILDTSWAGLVADWRPVDQRPLLELVRRAGLTDAELVERLPGLLRMTSSENAQIVTWALKQLTRLLEGGHLDAASLLDVRAPLTMSGKAVATTHLALLEKASRNGVGDPAAITDVAVLALDHPHDVVRERARRLVAKTSPAEARPPIRATVVEAEPRVRPLAPRFDVLNDEQDLVALVISSLERELSGTEVEQLLEATPRLGRTLDARARKAVVQARNRAARRYVRTTFGTWPIISLLAEPPTELRTLKPSVYASPVDPIDQSSYVGALTQRMMRVASSLRYSNHGDGLATPSRTDGSIELDDLLKRVHETAERWVHVVDIAVAALRLDPSQYDDAADMLPNTLVGRRLLGDLRRIRGHQPQWVPVRWGARISPFAAELHPIGPFGARGDFVCIQDEIPRPANSEPDILAALLDRRNLAGSQRAVKEAFQNRETLLTSSTQLLSLTLPHHREHYASHVLGRIRGALWEKEGNNVTAPILALSTGPGRTGLPSTTALALATALLAAEHRTAAVDALVERATYGELDGPRFGRALRDQLENDPVIAKRMATTLTEAGDALGSLARPILDALIELLPLLRTTRDGHLLAKTLADLSHSLGTTVQLPPELADHSSSKSSSALARAIRQIPS